MSQEKYIGMDVHQATRFDLQRLASDPMPERLPFQPTRRN
jgi:hypothetical protein